MYTGIRAAYLYDSIDGPWGVCLVTVFVTGLCIYEMYAELENFEIWARKNCKSCEMDSYDEFYDTNAKFKLIIELSLKRYK